MWKHCMLEYVVYFEIAKIVKHMLVIYESHQHILIRALFFQNNQKRWNWGKYCQSSNKNLLGKALIILYNSKKRQHIVDNQDQSHIVKQELMIDQPGTLLPGWYLLLAFMAEHLTFVVAISPGWSCKNVLYIKNLLLCQLVDRSFQRIVTAVCIFCIACSVLLEGLFDLVKFRCSIQANLSVNILASLLKACLNIVRYKNCACQDC